MSDLLPWIGFLLAVVVIWIAGASYLRRRRAGAAAAVIGADYGSFLLHALSNAAAIDGRIDDAERGAIVEAMSQATGAPFPRDDVDAALTRTALSKDDLVAYLSLQGRQFSLEQKTELLKGLLSVAMADGRFQEREHAIYLDYIAAVGFEHETAPQIMQQLVHDLAANKYS